MINTDINLSNLIYQQIKNDIIEMRRFPGAFVLERQLADEFSTSRTPVREALKRLMQEGWLVGDDRCRSKVSELTETRCNEVFAVRSMIENYALSCTFIRGDCRVLAGKLDLEIKNMEKLKTRSIEFVKTDLRFHTTIIDHLGNSVLSRIWQSISDEITRISIFAMDEERRPDIILKEHYSIMQALWNENPTELISLDRHMNLIMDGLMRTLKIKQEAL